MQIGNFEIGYLTEHIESDYAKAIDACQSLEQLKQVLKQYDPFVWIDSPRVEQWNENDFQQFKRFTRKERNIAWKEAKFKAHIHDDSPVAEMEKFSPILMPMPMFDISLMAGNFFVPFGTMLIRGIELGRYEIKDNRIIIHLLKKERIAKTE